jgi:hypothetical protein
VWCERPSCYHRRQLGGAIRGISVYYTYGAKIFYVFAEWLADGAARRKIVDDIAGFLPNPAITEAIIRAIDVHTGHSERQFVDECRAVLGV